MKYFKCQTNFEYDTIDKINEFRLKNNIKTFSKSVRKLIEYGLKYEALEDNLKKIDKIILKQNYTNHLIKQLYSDLELIKHTNIKNNKELKEIELNYFKGNYDK